jgi:gliding motility-associated-like protein
MALRSVRYIHRNTIDPLLAPKTLYFTVHDGETESAPKEKVIILEYTFVEFEIPSGFTPNGDQANDTWIIDRPGGGLEEMDKAIISVYNKQGVLVFRTKGFDRPWDGTMNGDLLPADSYFFTIDLQLRNRKTYKGIVTILR